ncbi:branched-chain amino acid ABC transporter permease [Bradyrhizobium liaoningense]
MDWHAIPLPALYAQIVLGLVNGSFYALLSLGLAVIFGLLNIINFAHGTMYMLGAFGALLSLQYIGMPYWTALVVVPIVVGLAGITIERVFLRHIYRLDHLYGLLLTFGLTLVIEGFFRAKFGVSGDRYPVPSSLQGAQNLGFMILPTYRIWVIAFSLTVCAITWALIEKTRVGSFLRAATENPSLTQALGIPVPLIVSGTFGFGVALAALAGVLAAPLIQVAPLMGSNLIIVTFAVVVIGGMGSLLGSVLTGLTLGVVEGLTKLFYPEAAATVVFVIMIVVLLTRPAGLFGRVR